MNSGICKDLIADFYCECQSGFDGKFCEIDIDECVHKVCLNEGTCVDKVNGAKCICNVGYTGEHCETGVLLPQLNGATTLCKSLF